MAMIRYPLPITAAMLTPADQNVTQPSYSVPAQWSMGVTGNDADIAARTEAVVENGNSITPYPIRTQTAKAAAMVPVLPILADIGKDYGPYAGLTGRTGTIAPRSPYPAVNP